MTVNGRRGGASNVVFLAVLLTVLAVPCRSEEAAPLAGSPFGRVARACLGPSGGSVDVTKGNRVAMVNNGDDALLLRCHLIRHATQSICIQTFIWTNDDVGRLLMRDLVEAAQRGVHVRIIADHFVSDKDPAIVAYLATAHPNLQVKHYRPTGGRIKPSRIDVLLKTVFRFKQLNQRMHNKILLVDDAVAITGGRNIENTYYNRSTGMTFKDRDVIIAGPVTQAIRESFNEFWACDHVVPSTELTDVAELIESGTFRRYDTGSDYVIADFCNDIPPRADDASLIDRLFVEPLLPVSKAEFLADKPGKNRSFGLGGGGRITRELRDLVEDAREELIIQSPYFVLSPSTRKLFAKLRRKRPELDMIVSTNSFGSTDNVYAYSANYKLRSVYIDDLGFQVHEYKPHPGDLLTVYPEFPEFARRAALEKGDDAPPPFLCIHAKSCVIDGRTAFIGSYNFDPRSANLNTEVGLLVEDVAFAARLRAEILNDIGPENSWVIAQRQMPLPLEKANALVEGLMRLNPVDLWPLRNTSSFELIPGKRAVPPGHPDFYLNHTDTGSFPGAPKGLTPKEITTRIYKAVGGPAVPLL